MKNILADLFADRLLTETEAEQLMLSIAQGEGTDAQLASLMTVYKMRSITPDELMGFRKALLHTAKHVNLNSANAIDLCGTGGDGKNTFNISTLAAVVTAAAGGKVVKHGNYGISSVSGSSDVLQMLGYKFTDNELCLQEQVEENNLCFLHAPLFHPALQRVGEIRRQLGFPTFFNLLGPLVNPARPGAQVMGVNSRAQARLCHYLAQQHDTRYFIIHSSDGYDEISLTASFYLYSQNGDQLLEPEEFGLTRNRPEELYAGTTRDQSAECFLRILHGKGTAAQENVVVANAAVALVCGKTVNSFSEGIEKARWALRSGEAMKKLNRSIQLSRKAA
ncbi:MAG: anthranilate phosphoribosyltransferase [Bacteroidia bacterium]|jgi:anthranilate phosphoribosyltransferase|nr:anthranilate phosphoribosyltransferase [Bacteroidia bacterium]